MKHWYIRILILAGVLFFTGLQPGCDCMNPFAIEEDAGKQYVEVDELVLEPFCFGASIEEPSAMPMDRIDVQLSVLRYDEDSILEVHEGFFAVEVHFEGHQESLLLPVFFDEDPESGGHYFYGPIHPDGIDGGSATLRFRDSEIACEAEIDLTIEPMPEAPGTFAEILSVSTELTRSLVEAWGYDPEELLTIPREELPVFMVPLAERLWIVDHPDNPNSLVRQMEEDLLALTPEEWAFGEALLARVGIVEGLHESIEAIALHWDDYAVEPVFQGINQQILSPGAAEDLAEIHQPLCSFLGPQMEVEINDVDTLRSYMWKAHTAEALRDTVELGQKVFSLAGLIPGVGVAGTLIGLFFTFDLLLRSAHANVFPRDLREAKVDGYSALIWEDDQNMQEWTGYNFRAFSRRWDATAEVANALMDLILSISRTGIAADNKFRPGSEVNTLIEEMVEQIGLDNDAASEFTTNLITLAVDTARGELMEGAAAEAGACVIETGPWGPFYPNPLRHMEILYTQAVGSRSQPADRNRGFCVDKPMSGVGLRQYEQMRTGDGRILLNMSSGFPPESNQILSRWRGDVRVSEIDVQLLQRERTALPGDLVQFEGNIDFAHDTRARWLTSPGAEVITSEEPTPGYHLAQIRTPSDPDLFPVYVMLQSRSDRGLRTPLCEPQPRNTIGVIRNDEHLSIDPKFKCIGEGGELQFEAFYSTLVEDPTIHWTASGGAIDQNGRFQSDQEGEFTIRAQIEGTDLKDSALVRVGNCECYFNVRLSGEVNASFGRFGGINANVVQNNLDISFRTSANALPQGRGNGGFFSPLALTQEGPAVLPASGTLAYDGLNLSIYDEIDSFWVDMGRGKITIHRWSEDGYIQGSFVGQARRAFQLVEVFEDPTGEGWEEVAFGPRTTIRVDFMTPVYNPARNPIGFAIHDCPG